MDEDEEKIAVAATFGISAVFKSPNKSSSSSKTKLLQAASKAAGNAQASAPTTAASATAGAAGMSAAKTSAAGPSNQNVDKERLTVDISALRQQYSKLRQRQKQAHIIFTCE